MCCFVRVLVPPEIFTNSTWIDMSKNEARLIDAIENFPHHRKVYVV